MKQQVYVVDATYYMEACSELLFDVFTVPECLDALKTGRTMRCAVAGDEVVGFIAWERVIDYLYWDLKWLATSTAFQGKGIGRLLVSHMQAHVQIQDGSYIRVETPSVSPSIAFYERVGFRVAHVMPEFYNTGRDVTTLLWKNPAYQSVQIDAD